MIHGRARIAGVMGDPVSHSLSPRLHQYWLKKYGIDGSYIAFEVKPEHLRNAFRTFPGEGVIGWNLTVPHKEAALKLVDEMDGEARVIGAVNTVVVRDDGSLMGSNTDAYGFAQNLKQQAGPPQSYSACALVLGAGGASRAVVRALQQMGMGKILITNRTTVRAEELATAFGGVAVIPWEQREKALEGVTLLVNTTTLGMQGQPPLGISLSALPAQAVVADIVYRPLMTDLLVRAKKHGCKTVTGLGMLIHQAVPGFSAWFDVKPEITPELEGYLLA